MKATLIAAGKYPVEQANCPATGPVNLRAPRAGVLHTTEGSFEGAYNEFRTKYAPHFLIGRDKAGKVRIVQFVSLGNYASALENHSGGVETNTIAVAQIELVGYSKQAPWQADAGVSDALASLLAELHTVCGIPLTRPFSDAMPPGPWAVESFSRRHAGKWGRVAGWYGHIEIPENSHWDPGAYKWTALLAAAKHKLAPAPTPTPTPTPQPKPLPVVNKTLLKQQLSLMIQRWRAKGRTWAVDPQDRRLQALPQPRREVVKEPLNLPRGTVRALLTVIVVLAAIAMAFVPVHGEAGAKQMIILLAGIVLRDYFSHREVQNAEDGPQIPPPSANTEG
jgi:hypothetical protein